MTLTNIEQKTADTILASGVSREWWMNGRVRARMIRRGQDTLVQFIDQNIA